MRRITSVFVISVLAVSLAGCGAGNNASTRKIAQVTDGVEAQVLENGNNIRVVNLLVIAASGGNAVLVGTIVNAADAEDTLLGVAINGSEATLTGRNTLPKNTPIIFEGERANAKAVLGGFGAPAGSRISVGLFFAKAGSVTLDAIVREAKEEYSGITAAVDVPMASASPTPSN